jgi:hypothetical protein
MHLSPCAVRNKKNFKNFGIYQKTLARKWITTVRIQNLKRYAVNGYGKIGRRNVTVPSVSAYGGSI